MTSLPAPAASNEARSFSGRKISTWPLDLINFAGLAKSIIWQRTNFVWMFKARKAVFWIALLCTVLPLLRVSWVFLQEAEAGRSAWHGLLPELVYDVELNMELMDAEASSTMRTFLPVNSERQTVLEEATVEGPGAESIETSDAGRLATWSGRNFPNPAMEMSVRHRFRMRMQTLVVDLSTLPDEIGRVRPSHRVHLEPTDVVQSASEEIRDRLISLGALSDTLTLLNRLDLVFEDVQGLRKAPFKGTTDALTALRLGEASCNGRSRLMVAMLRHLGVPARLVGGLILEGGTKQTSHQWLEAHLGGHWVPFDALNGHFGMLPANYLKLYLGDEGLFRHSAGLPFNYSFTISSRLAVPVEGLNSHRLWRAFDAAGIPVSLLQFLLLLPIGAVVVAVLRNVAGAKTFGLFLPALLAVSMRETGFLLGSMAFVLVIGLVAALHPLLERWRLMYTPKLVILLVAVVGLFLGISAWGVQAGEVEFAYITLFPIVIVAIAAERFARKWEEWGAMDALSTAFQTMLVVAVAYWVMGSLTLEAAFLAFPELFLVLVGWMLLLGRWTGVRLSEWHRFRRVEGNLLGMNARNVLGVFRHNSARAIALANDKIGTKKALQEAGVPVSPMLGVFPTVLSLQGLRSVLDRPVALKPAAGRGGGGILLLIPTGHHTWCNIHGGEVTWEEINQHATEVIHGRFSFGDEDQLLVEEMLEPAPEILELHGEGVADFRFIFERGKLLMAMLRLPTKASHGKANLHAGGVGVAIDLESGILGKVVGPSWVDAHHPDGPLVEGKKVPDWPALLRVAEASAAISPLGFVGVDLVLDKRLGPVVLEWNARPGLEIQNVHGKSLLLSQLDPEKGVPMPWRILGFTCALAGLILFSDQTLLSEWNKTAEETWVVGDVRLQENQWQWAEDMEGESRSAPGWNPEDPLVNLALEAEDRKSWSRALEIWFQLADLYPEAAVPWNGVARAHFRMQSWEKALRAYDEAIARDSLSHLAWVNSGIAASQLQRHKSATARYRRAQAIAPNRMSAWLNEGIAWVRAGEFAQALVPLNHAEERTTGARLASVLVYKGQALSKLNQFAAARQAFEEAISLNPDSELARLGLASLETKWERQMDLVNQVLQLNPTSSMALFAKGQLLVDQGDLNGGELLMERALDLSPRNEEVVRGLVGFYLEIGKIKSALALVPLGEAEAEWMNVLGPTAWFIQGRILAKQQNDSAAVKAYEKALAGSEGEMAEAWLNRGVSLRRLKEPRMAIASYVQAVEQRESYPEAWYNMALGYSELNRMDSAIWAYQQCLALDPERVNAHYNLGLLFSESGQTKNAIAAWRKAVELDPGMRKAWFNLGVNLRRSNQVEAAVAAYDSLLLRFPNDERAWYNRAIALRNLGQNKRAIQSYRMALEADPDYIAAWMNLGGLHADQRNWGAAARAYLEAVHRAPDDAEARFNLGLQLRRLNREDEAVLAFEQSAQLDAEYDRPRLQLLELYRERGNVKGLLRIQDDQLSMDSLLSWGGDSIYEYGRALHRADLQRRAISRYALSEQEGKAGDWPIYWTAKAWEELNQLEAANETYGLLLERNQSFKFGLYRGAMLKKKLGDLTGANSLWLQLEELYPSFAEEKWKDKP